MTLKVRRELGALRALAKTRRAAALKSHLHRVASGTATTKRKVKPG